jgi:hypothetical protein
MRLDNSEDREKLAYLVGGLLAVPWLAAEHPKRVEAVLESHALIQQTARAALIKLHEDMRRSSAGALASGDMPNMIRTVFDRAYQLGKYAAGKMEPLSPDDMKEVEALCAAEEKFAKRLAEDAAAGRVSEARLLQRLDMYPHALREVWNRAWVQYKDSPFFRWHMHTGAEHCVACIAASAGGGSLLPAGVYRKEELPFYPGRSPVCLTNCMCWLEAADGDMGAPQIREPASSGANPE